MRITAPKLVLSHIGKSLLRSSPITVAWPRTDLSGKHQASDGKPVIEKTGC